MGSNHVMVGGGYGVAPMRFLAELAVAKGERARVIIGARDAQDLLLVDSISELGAEVIACTEDGSEGLHGRVTDALKEILSGPAKEAPSALYACGPHAMLDALAAQCRKAQLPAQLAWEAYMRCGLGICGSCEHEGRLLCWDGPVLESK